MTETETSNLTAEEQRNLAAVERWGELFNDDVHRMIDELSLIHI